MNTRKTGFKLTPGKLLAIALIVVALIVFALVGKVAYMMSPAAKESISLDQKETPSSAPPVELLSPNGGKSIVVTVDHASQAPPLVEGESQEKDVRDNNKENTEVRASQPEEAEAKPQSGNDHPEPIRRSATKPQAQPKKNTEPQENSEPAAAPTRVAPQQETPVEPIRRSREPATVHPVPAERPVPAKPAVPANQPRQQREVMDNLF